MNQVESFQARGARSRARPTPVALGERAPFRSAVERGPAALDARVEGELPSWLRGDLVRTAPAVFERGAFRAEHWFDALGMLFAFRVADGRVRFRQSLMATEAERASRVGAMPTSSFGSPLRRGFLRRLFSPIPPVTDNANVNVLALGDERVAVTETPHQWAFDPETLEVTRRVAYDDALGALPMLAHAHWDPERAVVVNLATRLGRESGFVVYEHAPASRARRVVAEVKLPRLPYLHDFGLTPRHVVVLGWPLDVNPLSMLWSNRGFIDHFRYRPEAGATLWLVDRATGSVRAHRAPAGFAFHVARAFEDGERTVVDVAVYPDAGVVDGLRRSALELRGLPALAPRLVRYAVTPGREDASTETLLERGFEFPTVSGRARAGARHEVTWGARIESAEASRVVRLGANGDVLEHGEPGVMLGEPVFVARPGAVDEDDGVLLTVGARASGDASELRVLDARTLEPRAVASVPVPIPLGFHGRFFREGAR